MYFTVAILAAAAMPPVDKATLRDEVKAMFDFSFSGYMEHGWPRDEVKPGGCVGVDTYGGLGVTLIDSLDTLVVVGEGGKFCDMVELVAATVDFDKDMNVSVFETTIRVLGGLLSSHLLLEQGVVDCPLYSGELLTAAYDLGLRLLPAYSTPTHIPYGAVNLRHGVHPSETPISSLAGSGTNLIEFVTLSILTEDARFKKASVKAMFSLYALKSPLGLLGSHVDSSTGVWTHQESGIGGSADSYYEYLAKGYVLFGCERCLEMFKKTHEAIMEYVYHKPWWVEAQMYSGEVIWPLLNSLTAFYPGLIFNFGEYETSEEALEAVHAVWRRYGALPEGYSFLGHRPHPKQTAYPLRPEFAESIWQLYRGTEDPMYLDMGADMVFALNKRMKGRCGYHTLENVETGALRDSMESFFIAETLKYLYLLFDEGNFVNTGEWVMNTEGHPFPITVEFSSVLRDAGEEEEEVDVEVLEETKKTLDMRCPRIGDWRRFTVDGFKGLE